jgi:transposase
VSEERVTQLEKENVELRGKLHLAELKIDALARRIFGQKSEKGYPGQLELFAGGQPGKPAPPERAAPHKKARNRRKARRPRLPEDLPVEETVVEPPEVLADPGAWRRIGQEHGDRLDYTPGRFFLRRTVRPTYVSRADNGAAPVTAPLPPALLDGALAAPGLLANVLVSKYVDHLPLFRQEKIYRTRHGVEIPRQTMSRWVEQCALALQPIYNIMVEGLLERPCIQADETPVKYLEPGSGKAQTGYFWTFGEPGGDVVYRWDTSRGHGVICDVLGTEKSTRYQGTLQCDAFSAYRAYAAKNPEVTLCGCMAHVRRKFYEAGDEEPLRSNWIIGLIRQLYIIEDRLRQCRAGPQLRRARREAEAAPVLARLKKTLERFSLCGRHLPKSNFGKALTYALGQWEKLEVYVGDGHVEIDNNLMENAIRPSAVGKKNWLFIGAAGAGQKSAIIYTFAETCRRYGIEPYDYFKDVLERLPKTTNWEAHRLAPANWLLEKQSKQLRLAS